MNKGYKIIISMVAIFLIVSCIYSYFHVTGSEIDGVSDISSICSVTITKRYHLDEDKQEYILNAEQIEMLKTLLLNSSFTRDLSSVVHFDDKDMYIIQIDYNNQQDFLTIDCIGNEYISVTNQFSGKHLKINNSDWKDSLENIIALSS